VSIYVLLKEESKQEVKKFGDREKRRKDKKEEDKKEEREEVNDEA
jgi:hypothetical protein